MKLKEDIYQYFTCIIKCILNYSSMNIIIKAHDRRILPSHFLYLHVFSNLEGKLKFMYNVSMFCRAIYNRPGGHGQNRNPKAVRESSSAGLPVVAM